MNLSAIVRSRLVGFAGMLLLTSCGTLSPESRQACYGPPPSAAEITMLLRDYCTRNHLRVAVPKDSVARPMTARCTPGYMRPVAPGHVEVVSTLGPPRPGAAAIGYVVVVTEIHESPAGRVVGEIMCELFVSGGVVRTFSHQEKGDVHVIRGDRASPPAP
jgi:hypothetical protein